MQSLESQHSYLNIMFFLCHVRFNDKTGNMLALTIAHMQMELGISEQFVTLQYADHSHLITHTWVTQLWEFLNRAHITLGCSDNTKLQIPTQDSNIMETMALLKSTFTKDTYSLDKIDRTFNNRRLETHSTTGSMDRK
jgi:hypothetical protein